MAVALSPLRSRSSGTRMRVLLILLPACLGLLAPGAAPLEARPSAQGSGGWAAAMPVTRPQPASALFAPDTSLLMPAEIGAARPAGPLAATDALGFRTDVALTPPAVYTKATSVGPSVAANGPLVFFTGRTFAALSIDGGLSFRYFDPHAIFPRPNSGLVYAQVVEQVVCYVPQVDTFVWLLRYANPSYAAPLSIFRLATASSQDLASAANQAEFRAAWTFYDLNGANFGSPTFLIDSLDAVVGGSSLYVTMNWLAAGTTGIGPAGSLIWRVAQTDLVDGGGVNGPFWQVLDPAVRFRAAQNCGTTVFFATRRRANQLRIFSWDESSLKARFQDVTVRTGNDTPAAFQSLTPDGLNWLANADGRVLAGTRTSSELWFGWNAGTAKSGSPRNPYIQLVRLGISAKSLRVNSQPQVSDPVNAVAFPALATNSNDEVGLAYAFGGVGAFPGFAVALLTGTPRTAIVAEGTRGAVGWGPFLSIRPDAGNPALFAAAGYVLGPSVQPRFALFGRSGDLGP